MTQKEIRAPRRKVAEASKMKTKRALFPIAVNKKICYLLPSMHGKGSLLHQSVQQAISLLLPPGETVLEHSLPGHVADVVWLSKKIIFEIQCSPIPVETAVSRTRDLEKLGFFVVWILHQKNFNGTLLSAAELFLRKHPTCYYTNISTNRHGYIYDQRELFKNNQRKQRSHPLLIDLSKPIFFCKSLSFPGDRHQNWFTYLLKKIK